MPYLCLPSYSNAAAVIVSLKYRSQSQHWLHSTVPSFFETTSKDSNSEKKLIDVEICWGKIDRMLLWIKNLKRFFHPNFPWKITSGRPGQFLIRILEGARASCCLVACTVASWPRAPGFISSSIIFFARARNFNLFGVSLLREKWLNRANIGPWLSYICISKLNWE